MTHAGMVVDVASMSPIATETTNSPSIQASPRIHTNAFHFLRSCPIL